METSATRHRWAGFHPEKPTYASYTIHYRHFQPEGSPKRPSFWNQTGIFLADYW